MLSCGNSDDGVDDKHNDPHGVCILMHSYALSWLKLHKLQVGGHHGKCDPKERYVLSPCIIM